MKLIDTRKLAPEAQEALRFRAIRLLEDEGMRVGVVADMLGVSRASIWNWRKAFSAGGEESLKKRKQGRPVGSGRKLTNIQRAQIVNIIKDRCPDQLKMPFVLWNRKAVKELIKERFDVDVSLSTVGHMLRRWGFSPQKPARRSYEQQPERVRRWLDEEYPSIALRAKKENAEIHWGDETSLRSHDQVGRGYAPVGRTPVLYVPAKKFSVNMISSITNRGDVRFMVFDGTMDAKRLIVFLKRLLASSERKIFLILDNLRVHHANCVREWVAARKERIELFHLPPYAPELNPDEYLNCDVKGNANKSRQPKTKEELKRNLIGHMRRLQKLPSRIVSYFNHEKIQYARA